MPNPSKYPFKSLAELTAFACPKSPLPGTEDFQGWNSDHPIFDTLVADLNPHRYAEVGVWKGASLRHVAQATKQMGTELFAIDTWLGGVDHALSVLPQDDLKKDGIGDPGLYRQFLRNFSEDIASERIFPVRQTSVNAARILAHYGVQFDLIYVDGSHEYHDVYADVMAYSQLVAPNGRIFGDDFRMAGVFPAVVRAAHELGRKIREVDGNFWILSQ